MAMRWPRCGVPDGPARVKRFALEGRPFSETRPWFSTLQTGRLRAYRVYGRRLFPWSAKYAMKNAAAS